MKLEGINGLTPIANSDVVKRNWVFNAEFESLFKSIMPDPAQLEEFVYAVDTLIEIGKTKGFPSGRLLNNVDIASREGKVAAIKRFPMLAVQTGVENMRGIAVTQEVYNLVSEFFDYKYLVLINKLLTASGFPFAAFTLDGVQYQFTLARSIATVPGFSILRFTDTHSDVEVAIPFFSHRLNATPEPQA